MTSDTALAAYLALPGQRSFDLGDLVLRFLQQELRAGERDDGQLSLDGADEAAAVDSLGRAARATADLADALDAVLAERSSTALLADLELPLVDVLAEMEAAGIAVDSEHLASLAAHFGGEARAAAEAAHAVVGREFNLGSPKQLQVILFDEMNLPKTKRIKTGYTTDAEALQSLYAQTEHPLLEHLLRHRDVSKLLTTVEGLQKSVSDDGRIHTTYNQTVASTGRLSSTDPNLQNIPIRTAEGRRIRLAFIVGDGLRVAADRRLQPDRDADHGAPVGGRRAARGVSHPARTCTRPSRPGSSTCRATGSPPRCEPKIKAMSYGLAYGLSSYGLSQQLGISRARPRR